MVHALQFQDTYQYINQYANAAIDLCKEIIPKLRQVLQNSH